ncbi:cyclin-like protein [Clohesyomyces aquaticus]|uniref:Cyclin-like protein n=1 Tax=Clohesyomyces aquaticus TaxID=1231657 RepID=A0A1Y2A548_9PLEO|nr:cyclin-like protein [Clohesyomyces aquaticus]
MKLTEDDLYRTSTQFKHWSFTPSQLAAQRLQTNIQASERVKAAVQRQRAQRAKQLDPASASESDRNGTPVPLDREVNCLTVAEEKKLVDTFCEKAIELGGFFKFPIEVTATGIQFLRRFYLFNSPMTYEPQTISRSAMFVANKTEGHHMPLEKYAAGFPKATSEQVLAPEYLLVQALRFNFDIRHPFRALKGGHLDMIEMARGNAYTFASHILKTAALLTDAYFLYTPSQIWLSAHLLADELLTLFYLSTRLPPSSPLHSKTLTTLRSCAALLSSHHTFTSPTTSAADKAAKDKKEKEEVQLLIKKLRQCRDPDKLDLVKLNQAQKRDAVDGEGLEEKKAKRRKLEREGYQKEADSFWGPELPRRENGAGGK